ncbi:MAG: hypothetical protein ACE5ES_03680, partial [Candidatus Nanoarchaeia archaeon]
EIVGLFLIFVMLFVVSVSAIGVGFSQDVEVTLGESIDRSLSLQNLPAGNGDLLFKGTIEEGGEVVSFTKGDEFEVADGKIVQAPIRIKALEGAVVGQTYNVKILFKTSPVSAEGSGDTVQFNTGARISFGVEVVEKTEEPSAGFSTGTILVWILGILIVILIIWIILRNRKNNQTTKVKGK